jgi:hypothetical protein
MRRHGWADEDGDWLHNSFYVHVTQNAIRCGACPRFHP